MGWTFYMNRPACVASEINRLCTFATEEKSAAPIKACLVGSTWYVAVRVQMLGGAAEPGGRDPHDAYDLDATGAYTFAAVFLTRIDGGEWGYKDMDECMGPNEAEAPLSLLKLLSPTARDYAVGWRERCRKTAALKSRTVTDGDVIKLAEPITFTDNVARTTFKVEVERYPGVKRAKTVFRCLDTDVRCRIKGFTKLAWGKVGAPTSGDLFANPEKERRHG